MSEGEIKRLFIEVLRKFPPAPVTTEPYQPLTIRYVGDETIIDALKQILDLASKEFPWHEEYRTRPKVDEGEVLAWLKKWMPTKGEKK